MDPAVASTFATSLAAGLPDHAKNVVLVAARQRQQEQWQAEAKTIAQQDYDWHRQSDLVRQNMRYLPEQEWIRETHRRTRERGQFLEALAARARCLTQQQAMVFGLVLKESTRIPVERKRSLEKVALHDLVTDTLFAHARSRAKDPASLRIIDSLQQAMTTESLREAIAADVVRTPEGKATVAVTDVEQRLTEAVQTIDGLTPEQRAKVGDLVATAVQSYGPPVAWKAASPPTRHR